MDSVATKRQPCAIERAVDLPRHLAAAPTSASTDLNWSGLVAFHYGECRARPSVAVPRLDGDCLLVPLTPFTGLEMSGDGPMGSCDVVPGEFAALPRKSASRWSWRSAPEIMFLLPECMVMREIAASMTENEPGRFELVPALNAKSVLVHQIAIELKAEMLSDGLHGSIYVETLIQTLCAHLVLRHSTFGAGGAVASRGLDAKRLKNAIAYIMAHLNEDVSIEKIARAVHLSPFHFARAFKISTGRPPHQFVIERRIERAKQMLQSTRLTVGDIASECGFQNQSHFTILFRRRTGLTPNVYRDAR
jgi:AraC family transcriptional regulator